MNLRIETRGMRAFSLIQVKCRVRHEGVSGLSAANREENRAREPREKGPKKNSQKYYYSLYMQRKFTEHFFGLHVSPLCAIEITREIERALRTGREQRGDREGKKSGI